MSGRRHRCLAERCFTWVADHKVLCRSHYTILGAKLAEEAQGAYSRRIENPARWVRARAAIASACRALERERAGRPPDQRGHDAPVPAKSGGGASC